MTEESTSSGRPTGNSWLKTLREWVETIVVALLIAFVVRTFVVQVYKVDGESMEPTLHHEERLLVNKFSYWIGEPQPGDIVVLQDPSRTNRELIKRVVAVAGETIEVRDGVVYIDGRPLDEPYKNDMYTQYPDTPPVEVPEGTVFVMGDNRANSHDSRYPDRGPIPIDSIVGRAFVIVWPIGSIGGL